MGLPVFCMPVWCKINDYWFAFDTPFSEKKNIFVWIGTEHTETTK